MALQPSKRIFTMSKNLTYSNKSAQDPLHDTKYKVKPIAENRGKQEPFDWTNLDYYECAGCKRQIYIPFEGEEEGNHLCCTCEDAAISKKIANENVGEQNKTYQMIGLSEKDVADSFGVSMNSVRRWREAGCPVNRGGSMSLQKVADWLTNRHKKRVTG